MFLTFNDNFRLVVLINFVLIKKVWSSDYDKTWIAYMQISQNPGHFWGDSWHFSETEDLFTYLAKSC